MKTENDLNEQKRLARLDEQKRLARDVLERARHGLVPWWLVDPLGHDRQGFLLRMAWLAPAPRARLAWDTAGQQLDRQWGKEARQFSYEELLVFGPAAGGDTGQAALARRQAPWDAALALLDSLARPPKP